MNWKSTLVVLVLLAAAIAAVVWTRHTPGTEERQERAQRVFSLPEAEVVNLRIEAPLPAPAQGMETTIIERGPKNGPEWMLTSPIREPADRKAMEALLADLEFMHESGRISASADSAAYGFDRPRATVTVRTQSGDVRFVLGKTSSVGGKTFLRIMGRNENVAVDSEFAAFLAEGSSGFRPRRLFPFEPKEAVGLAVRVGPLSVELRREDGRWIMAVPVRDRANPSIVEDNLLQGLSKLEAVGFEPVGAASESRYGLDTPLAELRATLSGSTTPWTMRVGRVDREKGVCYVSVGGREGVACVPAGNVPRLPPYAASWRDNCLERFDSGKVQSVRVSHSGKAGSGQGAETFALHRRGEEWFIDDEKTHAEATSVFEFLRELASVGIGRYLDEEKDAAAYGLDPARQSVALSLKDAGERKVYFGKNDGQFLYARRDGTPCLFGVPAEHDKRLDRRRMFFVARRILNLDLPQMAQMRLTRPGGTVSLRFKPPGSWITEDGKPADVGNTQRLFERWGRLEAARFIAAGQGGLGEFGLLFPRFELAFQASDGRGGVREIVVKVGSDAGGGESFATCTESPYVFTVPSSAVRLLEQPLAP